MPRSTRAPSLAPAAKKRTSKKSTKQLKVYEIPESPTSEIESTKWPQNGGEAQESIESSPSATSSISSYAGGRGRTRAASSATLTDDNNATPTQSKPSQVARGTSVDVKTSSIPGFEAIEAVNGLYQKLKESQDEIGRLQLENQELSFDARK